MYKPKVESNCLPFLFDISCLLIDKLRFIVTVFSNFFKPYYKRIENNNGLIP